MKKNQYVNIVLSIIIAYICIKLIDNYVLLLEWFRGVIKVLSPFIIGVILAYILNPLVSILENKIKLKRGLSIFISISLSILVIILSGLFIIPILVESVIDVLNQMPTYLEQIEGFLKYISKNTNSLYKIDLEKIIFTQLEILEPEIVEISKTILNKIISATISITSIIINSILAIVVCIYILIDKENYIMYFKKVGSVLLKEKQDIVSDFFRLFNEKVGKYIIAKILDSIFIGLVAIIGLSILDTKYPVLMGVIIGITNMIPFFGPFVGGIPTVILNLFYSPQKALLVTIFVIILQQIDGNIISPKFIGPRVGINPFITLFSVTVGGAYFGVIGMVLAMPIAGILKHYSDNIISYYDKKNNLIKSKD